MILVLLFLWHHGCIVVQVDDVKALGILLPFRSAFTIWITGSCVCLPVALNQFHEVIVSTYPVIWEERISFTMINTAEYIWHFCTVR